jgi:proteic killer suppression protein
VIKDFSGRRTQEFWETGKSKGMPPANLRKSARKKLAILHAAIALEDLRIPPGNRLEALSGTGKGSTASGSTTSFACASFGGTATPMKWK